LPDPRLHPDGAGAGAGDDGYHQQQSWSTRTDGGGLPPTPAIPAGCIDLDAALPPKYRGLLPWHSLNRVQSVVYDAVYLGDADVAVAAPTGTGKTTIFVSDCAALGAPAAAKTAPPLPLSPSAQELAIIRLMQLRDGEVHYTGPSHTADHLAPSFTTGKVVYLAPLKALAREKYNDWSSRFGPAGMRVVCCTGDDDVPGAEGEADVDEGGGEAGRGISWRASSAWLKKVGAADIVITTPEKWDAITRRCPMEASQTSTSTLLIGSIAALLVDEVHLLGEERGAALEAVVSRMRAVSRLPFIAEKGWPAACLRIVAVSATLPNLTDVARWIGAGPATTFSFDESYRPVRLSLHIKGYNTDGNPWFSEKVLDSHVGEVVAQHSTGRPTLIFCASRNGARACAELLVTEASRFNATPRTGPAALLSAAAGIVRDVTWARSPEAAAACMAAAGQARDARLAECLRNGVGFHSAGACASDRELVESLFRNGSLPILATTTTLAMGVNLPAHLVVVKSTQAWRGAGKGYQEYTKSTLLQMLGRAGRPQFDTSGCGVIMTQSSTAHLYRSLQAGLAADAIESSLAPALVEHLASEICLGTVHTTVSAQECCAPRSSTCASRQLWRTPREGPTSRPPPAPHWTPL
jgi:ATP-dependent DNA helicase HFM1/MER3